LICPHAWWSADFSMLVKHYGSAPQSEIGYGPAICTGAEKRPKIGNPDGKHISTSYVEQSASGLESRS
jgi:hypothetical protein